MARKRKPPIQMQVEGLSTWVTLSKTEYDDFTGKPIAVKPESTKPAHKPESISAYNKRMREEKRQREIELARRYVEQQRKAYELIRATTNPNLPELAPLPEPKHNQVITESKLVITVPRPANSFKRRF